MSFTPRTDDVDNVMAVDVNEAYCLTLKNNTLTATSGSEVVVQDTTADKAFKSTTTVADPKVIGVVAEPIAAGANGLVMNRGHVAAVAVIGVVSRGDYLIASDTEWFAKSCGNVWQTGAFAIALTAAAGPGQGIVEAYLLGSHFGEWTRLNGISVQPAIKLASNSADKWVIGCDTKTAGEFEICMGGSLGFNQVFTVDAAKITINADGLNLDFDVVDDNGKSVITVDADGGLVCINQDGADVNFKVLDDDGAVTLFADAGLRMVGVNTDAPASALHVVGSVRYTGDLISVRGGTPYTGYTYVPLTTRLSSTSWDGDAFSDVSPTVLDLSAVFGVPANVKAVTIWMAIRDSGAAGAYVYFGPSSTSWSVGAYTVVGSDMPHYCSGICPCDANGDITYTVNATGTGTCDIWLYITGYFI